MQTTTRLSLLLLDVDKPQYIIAAELGVAPSRLSDYVNGKRPIPRARIATFCEYFHVNPEELLGTTNSHDFNVMDVM